MGGQKGEEPARMGITSRGTAGEMRLSGDSKESRVGLRGIKLA